VCESEIFAGWLANNIELGLSLGWSWLEAGCSENRLLMLQVFWLDAGLKFAQIILTVAGELDLACLFQSMASQMSQ
jgi:hypothetical protein